MAIAQQWICLAEKYFLHNAQSTNAFIFRVLEAVTSSVGKREGGKRLKHGIPNPNPLGIIAPKKVVRLHPLWLLSIKAA
ncbi:MAG: hypothetical protein Q7R47_05925 [Candidatus Diapherotrites archaeon]|nr:hypothetical protein [Candidatus Diapherotrites archaeon]